MASASSTGLARSTHSQYRLVEPNWTEKGPFCSEDKDLRRQAHEKGRWLLKTGQNILCLSSLLFPLQPWGHRCPVTWGHTGLCHWRRGGWVYSPQWLRGGRTSWTPRCRCLAPRGTPLGVHPEWSSCCLRTPAAGPSSAVWGIWWLCSPEGQPGRGSGRKEKAQKVQGKGSCLTSLPTATEIKSTCHSRQGWTKLALRWWPATIWGQNTLFIPDNNIHCPKGAA